MADNFDDFCKSIDRLLIQVETFINTVGRIERLLVQRTSLPLIVEKRPVEASSS